MNEYEQEINDLKRQLQETEAQLFMTMDILNKLMQTTEKEVNHFYKETLKNLSKIMEWSGDDLSQKIQGRLNLIDMKNLSDHDISKFSSMYRTSLGLPQIQITPDTEEPKKQDDKKKT